MFDRGNAIVLDASGNPVIVGTTDSPDFPVTAGAYDTSFNGGVHDVFASKLHSSGTTLLWSTFLGGTASDEGHDLALDASGQPVLTGSTASSNFPTTATGYDTSANGGLDAFVSVLSASGSTLVWSTFLGGSSTESGSALVLDATDHPVLTGWVDSSDFPTTSGAYDQYHNGMADAFVTMLDLSAWAGIDALPEQPFDAMIQHNLPNPFSLSTTIVFSLPDRQPVSLIICDIAGRVVRTLVQGSFNAGSHPVSWDGRDGSGRSVAAGVYSCRLQTERGAETSKLIKLR
jgi:hypothetical protein